MLILIVKKMKCDEYIIIIVAYKTNFKSLILNKKTL